jgi:DNA primase
MISEEEISQVRNSTDLVELIGVRTVLKQRRNEYWGCCPFHNEKTPSFKVDPVSQFYYCFGCGEKGDAFTFAMKTENVDFPDAVRLLAQRANIELKEEGSDSQRGRKARLLAVAAATTAFYHHQLMRVSSTKSDAARAYLGARGMGGDVAKKWTLGFAPGEGQLVKHLTELGFTTQEMVDVDVARYSNSGRGRVIDRFYDRIMFPIFDLQGRPIAFGGRIFLAGDENPAKYLNSAETVLFKKRDGLYAIDLARASIVTEASAIVVEGYTDTIALHQAGFTNAVATLGTALTAEHLRLLARFSERVVLLFDGDEAGQRAADRALDLISSALAPTSSDSRRADVYVALLPGQNDPADFVAKEGADALLEVLAAAVPLVRYGLDRTLARFDLKSLEQRIRAEAAVLQILLPLKNTAMASDYLSYISDRFNLNEMAEAEFRQRFEKMTPPRRSTSAAATAARSGSQVSATSNQATASQQNDNYLATGRQLAEARIINFERELIFLFIEQAELRAQLTPAFENTNWVLAEHSQLAACLIELYRSQPALTASECLSQLTARYPEAASTLAAARAREFTGIEPVRLADQLLFNIRETKLTAAIDNLNGEMRLLPDDDPKNQELFRQLVPLQQEIAELRKKFQSRQ